MAKRFRLSPEAIVPVAPGRGSCYASDRITVDGCPVGYAYREQPDSKSDSGWRFFAGDETQEYADDPSNFAIYDVNTIANYDREIVALLDEPAPAEFERSGAGQPLQKGHLSGGK
jgi:hypothetical protein